MPLKTIVKISGINNLSNARYCAGMGVDMLGFDMDTLSIEEFKEIRNWVSGVKIVGETKSESISEIDEKIRLFEPDLLEVNSDDLAKSITNLSSLPIIVKSLSSNSNLIDSTNIKFIHLQDADIDPLKLDFLNNNSPILLVSYEFYKNNINNPSFKNLGIALDGDKEERPGFSNFETTMDILESLDDDE